MSQLYSCRREPAFHDLLPWADPYIASLVEKVRRTEGRLLKEPNRLQGRDGRQGGRDFDLCDPDREWDC